MQTPIVNWQEYLKNAKSYLKNANNLYYLSLGLLKDNRLLVKVLSELHKSAVSLIKGFLYREVSVGKLKLTGEPMKDLNIFVKKVAPRYLKDSEIELIFSILRLAKQHKDSPLEFVRKENVYIFTSGKYEILTPIGLKVMMNGIGKVISLFSL